MCNQVDQGSRPKKKQGKVPRPAPAANQEDPKAVEGEPNQEPPYGAAASGAQETTGQGKQSQKPNRKRQGKGAPNSSGKNNRQNRGRPAARGNGKHPAQNVETEQENPREVDEKPNEVPLCEAPASDPAPENEDQIQNATHEENETQQTENLETEQEKPSQKESKEEEEKEEVKPISVLAAVPKDPQPNVKDSLTDDSLVYYTQDPSEYYYSIDE